MLHTLKKGIALQHDKNTRILALILVTVYYTITPFTILLSLECGPQLNYGYHPS